MGAVQDRSGITLAMVKARLGVSGTAEDDLIQEILDASQEEADDYLNNPFEDADGVELPIPSRVKRGIYKLIAMEYNVGDDGVELEAKSVKEGDIALGLRTWEERADMVTTRYWLSCRLEPGL